MAKHNISYDAFQELLDTVRNDVSTQIFVLDNVSVQCTISLGAAHYSNALGKTLLLKNADNNLYSAKENGRNKLVS